MGLRVKQRHFEQGRETAMTKKKYKLFDYVLFKKKEGILPNSLIQSC